MSSSILSNVVITSCWRARPRIKFREVLSLLSLSRIGIRLMLLLGWQLFLCLLAFLFLLLRLLLCIWNFLLLITFFYLRQLLLLASSLLLFIFFRFFCCRFCFRTISLSLSCFLGHLFLGSFRFFGSFSGVCRFSLSSFLLGAHLFALLVILNLHYICLTCLQVLSSKHIYVKLVLSRLRDLFFSIRCSDTDLFLDDGVSCLL